MAAKAPVAPPAPPVPVDEPSPEIFLETAAGETASGISLAASPIVLHSTVMTVDNSLHLYSYKPYASVVIDIVLVPQVAPQVQQTQASTEMNKYDETVDLPFEEPVQANIVLKSIEVAGLSASVSALAFAARGGSLVASLLATAPAWRNLDPLPVLSRGKKAEEDAVVAERKGTGTPLNDDGLCGMDEIEGRW